MIDIVGNYEKLKQSIPDYVKVVAVSKTRAPEEILALYNSGHKTMGENRVQELIGKRDQLPNDIEWHLIGHLQSNKVKYIGEFVTLIHSVDSVKLLKVLSSEGLKRGRTIECLLQVHIASEETKTGFSLEEAESFATDGPGFDIEGVRIRGLMGMASFVDDMKQVAGEFGTLRLLFDRLARGYFSNKKEFDTLSMGMSSDYRVAIDEGSNMIRVGSSIFGER